MLNFSKLIEILVSLQLLIISTMIPVYISLPFIQNSNNNVEIPITLQIPILIVITLMFNKKVVLWAFTIYIILGLFIIPVFHQGGSIGYLLTPNFGYLLGSYPLILIIDKLNKINNILISSFLFKGIIAIATLHLTGIFYNSIQILYYKQYNTFFYNLGKYSLGKIGYHFLMLIPLIFLIKPIKYLKLKK